MIRRAFVSLLFLFAFASPVFAEGPSSSGTFNEATIPEPLRGWVKWVRERDPDLSCPLVRDARACFWTGSIELEANEQGATFRQIVTLEREGRIAIPGGGETFPVDVSANDDSGKRGVPVFGDSGRPAVLLPAGRHVLTGKFVWAAVPQSLLLPQDSGLVTLRLLGATIEHPRISPTGELWLREAHDGADAEEDTLQVTVSRKLSDGVPFRIVTELELRAGGRAREVSFGKILPPGFVPVSTNGELVHAFDRDGAFKVQLRPGIHRLDISAVAAEPPVELSPPAPGLAEWPADEVWAWEANEPLRSVSLSGAPGIDPQRTTLPAEWKRFPAYILSKETKLSLKELRRGEQDLPPNQLTLHRRLWLDLEGTGFTIEDTLSGKMSQEWRLNMNQPTRLSRVEVSKEAQLITKDVRAGGKDGVELRTPDFSLRAVSRLEGDRSKFPAVGWDHDVSSLSAELILPPGWQILEIFGADNNPNTWLSRWTLWDLFFLVLVSIVVFRLKGLFLALVAFVGLALSHQVPGAPHYVWLNIIIAYALVEALPEGRIRLGVRCYLTLSCLVVAVILLSFGIDQVRSGLFPQLGHQSIISKNLVATIAAVCLIAVSGLTMVVAGLASLVYLFTRHFRTFFKAAGISFLGFLALSFFSTISFGAFSSSSYRSRSDYAPLPQQMVAPGGSGSNAGMTAYESASQIEAGDASIALNDLAPAAKSGSSGAYSKESSLLRRQKLLQIDQKAVVQTGVGLPEWGWQRWSLSWNGPVERGRQVEMILLSPRMNLLLSLARIVLFVLLLLSFSRGLLCSLILKRQTAQGAAAAVLLLAFVFSPSRYAVAQEVPSEPILKELEQRVTAKVCKANCLAANDVRFVMNAGEGARVGVTIEAVVSSDGPGAWPVPGPLSELAAGRISVDGAPTDELRRDDAGMLWVRIPSGVHRVHVEGSLARRTSATLQFGLVPQHVGVEAKGWSVDGITPTGAVGESIQIVRQGQSGEKKEDAIESQAEAPLPDWFRVTRELTLGQPWVVTTSVQRFGNTERAQIMRLPVLAGESVTEAAMKVEGGNVQVAFPRGEATVTWSSTLREEARFELMAPKGGNITEEWKLRCATIWRCSTEGIRPVRTTEGGEFLVDWQPWPGEKVAIEVAKPLGVDGLTETVTSGQLAWDPGSGLLRGDLTFTVLSSQGGFRTITLPEGALVQQVLRDSTPTNIMPKGRALELPLQPGTQRFQIKWQQPWSATLSTSFPAVNLGSDVYNFTVTSSIPQKRWLVWAAGPAWGPAVLFWGGLFVVIVFGAIVGCFGVPPLSLPEWILLGLGTATLHPAILLAPVVWSLAVETRRRKPFENAKLFDAAQIVLLGSMVAVFLLLFASLYCGLIVDPDMGVRGGGSTNRLLRWYVDRSGAVLPTPTIVWLPMWIYRAFMLVWSTWLVLAVLRWVRWAWKALGESGWWKPLRQAQVPSNEVPT